MIAFIARNRNIFFPVEYYEISRKASLSDFVLWRSHMNCFGDCSSLIILLLLLSCFGCCGNNCGNVGGIGGCNNNGIFGDNNCSCQLLIILLLFCGGFGNFGCGNVLGTGCGCKPNPCC